MTRYRFTEETPMDGLERPAEPGLVIGRAPCDVELTDPQVSRRHALLRQIDSQLAIEDLGSTNGTFVNGRRVQGVVELAPGDRISFGRTVWRLQGVRAAAGRDAQPTEGGDVRRRRGSEARALRPT